MTGAAPTTRVARAMRRLGRPLASWLRRWRNRTAVREALPAIRGARGVRLVLVYHRVAPREAPRYEIVPTVPLHLFKEHLQAFGELGRIEPLHALLDRPGEADDPPRFALTFDDDYDGHARHVLPVLRDLNLHATFFLSGRSLHGLGAYWFVRLEALVAELGLPEARALLDAPEVTEEARLALRCEGDSRRQALIEQHAPEGEAPLDAAGMRRLVDGRMTIGFHTLHHPVLPLLDDESQRHAINTGHGRL
jgi:peptidoglycan/xylan/chitin deacetylase (PgdA/CDA1 family)